MEYLRKALLRLYAATCYGIWYAFVGLLIGMCMGMVIAVALFIPGVLLMTLLSFWGYIPKDFYFTPGEFLGAIIVGSMGIGNIIGLGIGIVKGFTEKLS